VVRRGLKKTMHGQGLGRHSREDLYRRGAEDVDAIAALLADQPFFLGERPTTVDCSVFAFTSGALMHPADNPLKERMAGHANLVAYNDRMYQRFFGDHPPGSSKP
jgi:glutathione S-transferase